MAEIRAAGFEQTLQAGLFSTFSTAFTLGVLFHWSVVRFEIDGYGWRFVGAYLASVVSLWRCYCWIGDFQTPEAAFRTALVSAAFNIGLATSILAYRLIFHKLRKFPGPQLAAASRFYAMYLAYKNTQYSDEVEKLHKQYGDFVRIGPREVSINRSSAVQLIYGPPSVCRKSPWYAQVTDDVTNCSLNSTRLLDVQRQRRRAWDRGLGVKALTNYEPRIKAKTDTLISQIRKRERNIVDGTEWSMFFSFDVMGEVGLGKDFETLKTGKPHPTITGIHESMAVIGLLSPIPWFLKMLATIPGATSKLTAFMSYCADQVKEKEKKVDKHTDPQDILSWLIKARFENDKSAPPGEGALHEDARLLIIAGSDTTANALANTLNFLARHSRVLKKLQKLLDEAFPRGDVDWSYEKVKQIGYLDDVINESLRIRPPVPSGLARLTPPEGFQIDEVYIPGDIIVSVPAQTLHHDPRNYDDPLEFIPERWSDGKLNPETAPFITFSRGAMNCAGKQLAKMELRMFIAGVALNFDVNYAPGETGETFQKKQLDTFTLSLPPLPLKFTSR